MVIKSEKIFDYILNIFKDKIEAFWNTLKTQDISESK